MAKDNKFRKPKGKTTKVSDAVTSKKPSKTPSIPLKETQQPKTHPREPSSSDDKARTRPRTNAKPWADGDEEPRFAKPSVPVIDEPLQSNKISAAVAAQSGPPDYTSLLPPHLATSLSSQFDIHALHIIGGAKINAKVTTLLGMLENGFSLSRTDQRPAVAALTANIKDGNKLISVVEISKRELEKSKFKWFQYSALGSRLEEMKTKLQQDNNKGNTLGGRTLSGKSNAKDAEKMGEDVDMQDGAVDMTQDDEEDAFETMVLPERTKVRAISYLTIYMSRVPISQLKNEYGEQSYDPRKGQK